jgi:telomerase protein component 1
VPDSHALANVHSNDSKLAWLEHYAQQEPTNTSITELEIECAAFRKADRQTSLERTFFYFRDNQSFRKDVQADVYREHFDAENVDAQHKLARLKKKILSESFEVFNGYTATWYGIGTAEGISRSEGRGRAVLCDLNGLAKRVFDNLFNAIAKAYATDSDNETTITNETTTQTTIHNNYVQTIAKQFIGRQKLLSQCDKLIKDKMNTKQAHIMVIDGDSGCGKTALICRLGDLLMANDEQPSYVFSHVVGACDASQYVVNFLRRFEIYANRTFDLDLDETSDIMATNDLGHHRLLFNKILVRLTNDNTNTNNNNRLFILVDGVDMLVDNNSNSDVSLNWLPDTIPDMITFILTANSQTSRVHDFLAKRASYTNKDNRFAYDHVALPELDILDKSELVRDILGRHNKSLNETGFNNQMRLMTSKRDAHSPLYLTLACEELRLHNNYDTLGQKLKDMPQRLALFIPYVLGRLEADFGPLYVSSAFLFLLCAKDDLHVYELKAMMDMCLHLRDDLANDADLYARIDKIQSIMAIEASKIVLKHLSNTEIKFRTFVQSIKATFLKSQPIGGDYVCLRPNRLIDGLIRSKYAKTMAVYDSVHKLMAIYYWLVGKPIETHNPRAFVCLPYHLCASGLFGDLVTIVCDLKFLSTKCMLGLGAQVLDDFDLHRATITTTKYDTATVANKTAAAAVAQQVKHLDSRRFADYKAFIATNYHILSSCPSLFYQQVFNEPSCTVPAEDLTQLMAANREFRNDNVSFVFKMLNRDDRGDDGPTVRRLNDFTHAVTAMAVSPNGQYLTCGTDNCQIRVYFVATGKLLRLMHGHSGRISDLCFLDDDKLCSTSNDGLACLWNFLDGFRIRILNKHNGHVVSACVAQPGTGKKLITVGWDCTIRIWNKADGNYDGEIKGHGRPINCSAFHPDGQLIATGCWDACLRLFHLDSRQRKAVLRGHLTSIRSVAYAPNGVYLASAAIDGDVILWNSINGSAISVLKGHKLPVNCLRYTDNGNLLVTCSNDRKTKVWSGTIGKMVKVIRCQQQLVRITSVRFNHQTQTNVKTMAVGLSLGEIRIYDTDGNLLTQYNMHNAAIVRLRFTTDGNYLVSTAENGSVCVTVVNCSTHRVVACFNGSAKSVNALAISCTTNGILTGSEDCLLRYYGNVMTRCDEVYDAVYSDHGSPITACVYNSQGTRLVSVDKDATIIFWRVAAVTGALAVDFKIHKAHMDWITDCDWSNTSDFIVTGTCLSRFKWPSVTINGKGGSF